VKVIAGNHPLALAAADKNTRFPGRTPTRIGESRFGGLTVDDVCLYPTPIPVAV
jgi:hypothetical protein